MTDKLVNRYRQAVEPLLVPGEQLQDVATVIPVAGAKGLGDGAGAKIGNKLGRIGAVSGETGSLAHGFPTGAGTAIHKLLMVTDRRVAFVSAADIRRAGEVLWHVPRHLVTRIERRPRFQAMARFRLHFADGSAVSAYTLRRRTIESLADRLGR
ncbi:hypothetical protein BX285_6501 [Streptomyces sp. 1114.5]|uniref:hypothetical protein n=1 Tax=unclassified Streptomyces TaxID=2593676 RepID=UPI000BD01279|nr:MULTISPECIES: hypothetical protein [unclassified Streptomyces]RKT09407.1 hypothetical protein BX285_6501 [Streptomyces sp. 1114.5]SOB88588.1 hypothetical protein SAMN06272789_6875 [Streptomyces sp. 1331.2]